MRIICYAFMRREEDMPSRKVAIVIALVVDVGFDGARCSKRN